MDSSEDENSSAKHVSCDTIRKKITLFLATKEMTQTAFLSAIGNVNNNSFGRFMKLKGPYSGNENGTYWGARKFFANRTQERKTASKVQKKSSKKRSVTDSSDDPPKSKTRKTSPLAPVEPNVTAVELPYDLPVFDDCDEVRTKIGQAIHKKEFSQSSFARAIGMTTGAISNFLAKRGYNQGAGSNVYYNAYRYFERQRLQRGEPKSMLRKKNELKYPQGYKLENPPTHQWVFVGKRT